MIAVKVDEKVAINQSQIAASLGAYWARESKPLRTESTNEDSLSGDFHYEHDVQQYEDDSLHDK